MAQTVLVLSNNIDELVEICKNGTISEKEKRRIHDLKTVIEAHLNEQETILHIVLKELSNASHLEHTVKVLVELYPKLIVIPRMDKEHAGQTPLHMAVCKGSVLLVKIMLQKLKSKNSNQRCLNNVLERCSIGTKFTNTVMMGELPLTIAALTGRKEMFRLLLGYGAKLDATNSQNDNVCHTIIRYAYLYSHKIDDLMNVLKFIAKDLPSDDDTLRRLSQKIWLMENKQQMTPLQLAASYGLHKMFIFIMNTRYCTTHSEDGIFDKVEYDITDIDAVSSMTDNEITGIHKQEFSKVKQPENLSPEKIIAWHPFRRSILMMILELNPRTAYHFIIFSPVKRVIQMKWKKYCPFVWIGGLLHLLFMSVLTWYAVERAQMLPNNANNGTPNVNSRFDTHAPAVFKRTIPGDAFTTAYGSLGIVVAAFFVITEVIRKCKGKMQMTIASLSNPYSNLLFRLFFLTVSSCLIADFGAAFSSSYQHYCLILAIILGWFLMLFYIRVFQPFSFFTVLIQEVLTGDVLRFSVILALEIMGFSTAMYISIQGSNAINDDDYRHFGRVIVSMFNLMVGLGDVVSFYETRQPLVCILIFVGFIVLTAVLMMNALIAMMSRTCLSLVEDFGGIKAHKVHSRLEKLSIILFIESVLPDKWVQTVGEKKIIRWFNNFTSRRHPMTRQYLVVRALRGHDEEEHVKEVKDKQTPDEVEIKLDICEYCSRNF